MTQKHKRNGNQRKNGSQQNRPTSSGSETSSPRGETNESSSIGMRSGSNGATGGTARMSGTRGTDIETNSTRSENMGALDQIGAVLGKVHVNPVPMALISVGAGWLLWDAFGLGEKISLPAPASRRLKEIGREVAAGVGQARTRAGEALGEIEQRAETWTHQGGDGIRQLVTSSRRSVGTAGTSIAEALEGNPAMLGAVGLAVGVGIGLLLPHTSQENAWMGEAREQALGRVKTLAEGARDAALTSAKAGLHAVQAASEVISGHSRESSEASSGSEGGAKRERAQKSREPRTAPNTN